MEQRCALGQTEVCSWSNYVKMRKQTLFQSRNAGDVAWLAHCAADERRLRLIPSVVPRDHARRNAMFPEQPTLSCQLHARVARKHMQ